MGDRTVLRLRGSHGGGNFNFKETGLGYIHTGVLAMKWPLRMVFDVAFGVLLRLGFI